MPQRMMSYKKSCLTIFEANVQHAARVFGDVRLVSTTCH
jgi:hypothetical protein